MLKWCHKATVCYTYLANVLWAGYARVTLASLYSKRKGQKAQWFTRGRTLQELLDLSKMDAHEPSERTSIDD